MNKVHRKLARNHANADFIKIEALLVTENSNDFRVYYRKQRFYKNRRLRIINFAYCYLWIIMI